MRAGAAVNDWKVSPLLDGAAQVHRSVPEDRVHLGVPTVAAMPGGRIILAFDQQGMGVRQLPGHKGQLLHTNHWLQGRLFISNDRGQTWAAKGDFPFGQPCLFRDGQNLYLAGHRGNAQIMKSADGGETWSGAEELSPREGPCSQFVLGAPGVWATARSLYLGFMTTRDPSRRGGQGAVLMPVILRAPRGADLLNRRTWSVIETGRVFAEVVTPACLSGLGVPFFAVPDPRRGERVAPERWANAVGWGEAHIVQAADPSHAWHDPSGRTLHVVLRADAHRANLAVLLKLMEDDAGHVELALQSTPAGGAIGLVPWPGGHQRFALAYDETSRLFWLASAQATDSMAKPAALPRERFGLPADECHRLQLSFSRNLVDWNFAALLAAGTTPADARTNPALAIRGADLVVACSAGEPASRSAHHPNRILCGVIQNFRDLVYF